MSECDDIGPTLEDELERLEAENERLKDELAEIYRVLGIETDAGLPLKGVIKDGKVEWTGVDSPQQTD